ncbi:MAG: restriction endonuclease subunit S [Cocleimonas sp.]|nr:restriction endonuclease subunit S [Cocleimonas sp.]
MIDDKHKKLIDISSILPGHPIRGVITEKEEAGVFVVQLKDASPNRGVDWSSCIEIELTGKRKPDWVEAGDILFSSRGRNNHAVLVDSPPEAKKIVAAPHFFIIRDLNSNVLPAYLTWLLNQPPCQRHFKREAEGSHTKNIRRGVIEDAPVVIPSLQKQKNIINLAEAQKQQQFILKQLIHNGERTMNAIANDLFVSDTQ